MPDQKAESEIVGACATCRGGMQSGNSVLLGNIRGYSVRLCPACGLAFVHPKPTLTELSLLYSTYHTDTGQLQLSSAGERVLFEQVLSRVRELVCPPGELLDVGSSYGHFLHLARSSGFDVKGLEIAAEPAKAARDRFGLDVEERTLEESHFENGRFTAITLLNVLEHLSDPITALKECWRVARPGAALVIVVPNRLFAYPYLRATRALGLEWKVPTSAYDVPFHLTLFSPASLNRLIVAAGWKVSLMEDAPVIRNASRLRTFAKGVVHAGSKLLAASSEGRLLLGYSLVAVAEKPCASVP